jgi:hypothetical protein
MRVVSIAALALLFGAPARASDFRYLQPAIDGRLRCAPIPEGWQKPEFDDSQWLAPPPPDGGTATPPGDGGVPDGGVLTCDALRIRRSFDVGPEADRLATLTLSIRYQDGVVAWLNGVEVARRRLPPNAPLATESHGPEPEHFVVPVAPGLLRPHGNVVAIEIRPSKAGRNPAGQLTVEGADAVRFSRGPYLQKVLDGEGWIIADTDLPSRAKLRYGNDAAAMRETTDDAATTHHVLHMTHLAAATAYHYELSASAGGNVAPVELEADFHTPPNAGHPLRFVVVGDVRSGHDIHAALAAAIAAEDPDLVIMTGDLVDRGTDEGDWERYFEIAAPLLKQVAVYPAVGNHEYVRKGHGLQSYIDHFMRGGGPNSWWSYDVAGVHFVVMDSEAFKNPAQIAWLATDLAAARKKHPRAIFAYDHDGPWSSQLHGDNPTAIHDVAPLLEKFRVTMVFAGHDHDYERGKVGNLDYVVSGGGGAELRTPRCGVPGIRKCGPRVRAFSNEHHYISVEILHATMTLCPKRADGTLLEECVTLPLKK